MDDFNPRSPRGGATGQPAMNLQTKGISIHAPHEGERPAFTTFCGGIKRFQSTLPTRGSDVLDDAAGAIAWIFQSTLPTRGSDRRCWPHQSLISHFNPRSPRGGATGRLDRPLIMKGISIHAPHEGERPVGMLRQLFYQRVFQSTLPTRGSDGGAGGGGGRKAHFNPRSPRGGATAEKCICMQHFREFTEYYPLRHGDACCIAPQDCIIQAFFGAKKRCFYVRLCFALKNKGVRG